MLTSFLSLNRPGVHCHVLPDGTPHVHERFGAAPHPGHRVIAVCGKGGVGKTAVSALMATSLARSGRGGRLLVIDADPAFGLAIALGLETDRSLGAVRDELLAAAKSGSAEAERAMAERLDYLVFESLVETDDFAFLAMGRSHDLGCYCSVNDLLRDAVELLAREFDTIIIDGEAGLEQVNRQVVAALDDLVVVTDGSNRGARTVETLWDMAAESELVPEGHFHMLLNRQGPALATAPLREDVTPHLLGTVPASETLAVADRAQRPLTELASDNPACAAVESAIIHLLGH